MRAFGRTAVAVFAFALVVVVGSRQVSAQDPVKVAPDVFKVLLENPHVRVLEVNLKPGLKVAAHVIAEHVGYVTEAGKLKIIAADGTAKDMDLKLGEVKYGPAETHTAENAGTTPVRGVIVELRDPAPAAGTATLGVPSDKDPAKVCGEVTKVLFENDRVRVTETNLKAGGKMAMHGHPPHVVYGISGGKMKGTGADGKPVERELTKGAAVWSDAVTHTVENAGTTDTRVLNFELKQAAAAPTAKPADKKP